MGGPTDEADHSRGDEKTCESLNIFNVKSNYDIGQDGTIPIASTSIIEAPNDVNIHTSNSYATIYEMVCTTMNEANRRRQDK